MRILSALIVLCVLVCTTSVSALTSQPARCLSLRQISFDPELVVARRSGAPYRYNRNRDYRSGDYRYRGSRQYRPYVEPQTRAAPMERVPQVAPLAPRK